MSDWVDDPTFKAPEDNDGWVDDPTFNVKEEKASPLASGVRKFVHGATAGFSDEAAGLMEGAGKAIGLQGLGGPMKDISIDDDGPSLDWEVLKHAYNKARKKERDTLKKDSSDNPVVSGVADIAGSIASPVNKIAKGMSLVKGGAALGGINALGNSEAEDALDLAKDTALGAGIGGSLGYGVEKISPMIQKGVRSISDKSKDLAERMASRALGAERGTIKSIGADKVKAAGRYALDEGLLSPLASTDDVIARNAAKQAEGGAMMGKAYQAIDDAGASTFNPLDVASKVDESIGGFYRSPINRGETNQLENTLESILMRGDSNIPLKEAQALKQELGKVANWKNNLNITDKEKMAREAYGVVSTSIDDAVNAGSEAIGKAGLLDTLKNGKQLFSNASTAEKLLGNKFAREEGNKILGMTDWEVLGSGGPLAAASGGAAIPATLGVLGAKKGLERYGAQNAALGFDKISKSLMKSPQMAELYKKSPQAFQAIVSKLEQRMSSVPMAADSQPQEEVKQPAPNKPPDKDQIFEKAKGSKYSQVLQKAAEKGDQSFNAAHYVLSQRDPEYRKTIEEDGQ